MQLENNAGRFTFDGLITPSGASELATCDNANRPARLIDSTDDASSPLGIDASVLIDAAQRLRSTRRERRQTSACPEFGDDGQLDQHVRIFIIADRFELATWGSPMRALAAVAMASETIERQLCMRVVVTAIGFYQVHVATSARNLLEYIIQWCQWQTEGSQARRDFLEEYDLVSLSRTVRDIVRKYRAEKRVSTR